jgi:hypothetical protein
MTNLPPERETPWLGTTLQSLSSISTPSLGRGHHMSGPFACRSEWLSAVR